MPFQEIGKQGRAKAWRRRDLDRDVIDICFQCQQPQPILLTAFRDEALGFRS